MTGVVGASLTPLILLVDRHAERGDKSVCRRRHADDRQQFAIFPLRSCSSRGRWRRANGCNRDGRGHDSEKLRAFHLRNARPLILRSLRSRRLEGRGPSPVSRTSRRRSPRASRRACGAPQHEDCLLAFHMRSRASWPRSSRP